MRDLVHAEPHGLRVFLALREPAEAATHVADVGEVDVPHHDEAGLVALAPSSHHVRSAHDRAEVVAVRLKKNLGFRTGDLMA
jgi:hypothetical protein